MRVEKENRGSLVIRLFGPLAIEDGARTLGPRDLGGSRPKQVLEILLAARGHRVATDRLADLLWPRQRPRNAAGSLHTFVSALRRHLTCDRAQARELVVTEAEAYRFATDLVDFDLDRFDRLVERSAREPTRAARRSLEQALALVRGELLEDEPYAVWAQDLRGTYQGRVLGAHLDAADAALAELDYAGALAHTDASAELDRFSERAQRTAMLALYALGRQHEALRAYRRFCALIDGELGLEPTAQSRALQSAILRQEDVCALLPRPIERPRRDAGERSVRLLGRANELGTLERAARQALGGSFALLLIEAEAGLGKTRLLDELAASLVGVRVGRASCSELERHLPYVPLAAALRDALTRAELSGQHQEALRKIVPELTVADPPAEFSEIEVLEALVGVLAGHAPLVLLLDDLQWADQATITALSYLQRRGAAIPAALVAAVRTEDAPPGHLARRLRPDTIVRLNPLTPAELAPLAVPDLHEATGGNPRFVVETMTRGSRGELPATLAETLLARCRSEGAASYRALLAASTLAQPFDPEPLAALLRADAAELTEELEWLCERRILRVDGPRFRFRYDLVREVLLASVSPARRRLLRQQPGPPADPAGSAPVKRAPR
ncbi:MAG TPA: BTAD domain-containing putative transcriptional regulator [Streptosporangiaceae bacterium]